MNKICPECGHEYCEEERRVTRALPEGDPKNWRTMMTLKCPTCMHRWTHIYHTVDPIYPRCI